MQICKFELNSYSFTITNIEANEDGEIESFYIKSVTNENGEVHEEMADFIIEHYNAEIWLSVGVEYEKWTNEQAAYMKDAAVWKQYEDERDYKNGI